MTTSTTPHELQPQGLYQDGIGVGRGGVLNNSVISKYQGRSRTGTSDFQGVEAPRSFAFASEKVHLIRNQTPEYDRRQKITRGGREVRQKLYGGTNYIRTPKQGPMYRPKSERGSNVRGTRRKKQVCGAGRRDER